MKRIFCIVLTLVLLSSPLLAQNIKQMDFRNQPIVDILLALAEVARVSIVPDETVSGNASFFFVESDFRVALSSFLGSQKLFMTEENGIIYVSRIRILPNSDGTFNVNADEVDPLLVLRALSRAAKKTILYDPLPRSTITLNAEKLSLEKIMDIIMLRYPDYSLQKGPDSLYVKKKEVAGQSAGQIPFKGTGIKRNADGTYNLDFEQYRLREAVITLMELEKKEFISMVRLDVVLERMVLSNKPFDTALRLVLEQAGADFSEIDGIIYIFEIQKRDILKKLRDSTTLEIKYLPVSDLVSLLPQELGNTAFFKIDKTSNSLILTGSKQELDPLIEFIKKIDVPQQGRRYYSFRLNSVKAKDFIALCPTRLFPVPPILLADEYAFAASLSEEGKTELDTLLALLDVKRQAFPVLLRYLKNEDFFKLLPPSISKDDVMDSGFPGLVFYIGAAGKRQLFLNELSLIDKPKPQLRYDVLVIQSQVGNGLNYGITLNAKPAKDTDTFSLTGSFDKLLSINFDILGEFGYLFANSISLDMTEKNSRIFIDTTITSLVGVDAKLQNTNTYRYRDLSEIDPDTGKPRATVVREVVSGLTITINGWISNDNMVTMTITASVTERGSSGGSDSAPPETFERVVTSNVRTPAGVPLAISGLIQRKKSINKSKIPFFGDIPLIGFLFTKMVESDEETQFTIYIVPRLVGSIESSQDTSEILMNLYSTIGKR